MIYLNLLLQAGGAEGGGMINFLFMGAMLLVFWFFMIRPQANKQKEQTKFEDSLDKGTEVATASGILGKITKIEDNIVTLEVAPKVYIRVTRNAISKEMTNAVFATADA